jgi:hypothetical protein
MAFLKKPDEFSVRLADARREHRPFNHFKFNLRKFSPSGGVLYKFDLEMQSVFMLDIEPAGDFEKVCLPIPKRRSGLSCRTRAKKPHYEE